MSKGVNSKDKLHSIPKTKLLQLQKGINDASVIIYNPERNAILVRKKAEKNPPASFLADIYHIKLQAPSYEGACIDDSLFISRGVLRRFP